MGKRTRLFAVAIAVATGCSSDGAGGGGTQPDAPAADPFMSGGCVIDLRITGGVDAAIPPLNTETACASQIGSRSFPSIDVDFLPLDGPSISTKIDGVLPGETGTFPAELTIDPPGTAHRTTCMATIDSHTELGPGELNTTHYRVRGRFVCTEAAISATGMPATIEKFEWVTEISWFD